MPRRSWGFAALVAALTMAAACGIDAFGTAMSGAPDASGPTPEASIPDSAPVDASPDALVDEDAPSIEVVGADGGATDAPSDATLDAPDAELDGAVCLPNKTPCDAGTASMCCVTKQCNAYSECGKCSSSTQTLCSDSNECCLGFFCGRRPFEFAHCYQCLAKGERCQGDIMCCSGDCDDGRCK